MLLSEQLSDYIETLSLSQGRRAGELFQLEEWQRDFLKCFDQPGDAALTLARGGGKTTFCAAIAAACVDGPLVEPRAECIIVASSFTQGLLAFDPLLAFLAPVIDANPRRYRVQNNSSFAGIRDMETGVRVKVLGCDPRRAHGIAPKLMLLDEVAQWPGHSLGQMVAALRTSRGKIPGSKALWLGTRADSEQHAFSQALSGGVAYSQVHAADKDDPPFVRETWLKANPGLNSLPDLDEAIREESELAKTDPEALASFKALRLNLGVSDTVRSVLLDADSWARIEGEAERAGAYILGIDLGGTAAMSAAAAYFPETGRLESLAVFPELPDLTARGRSDGVGRLYTAMRERGELLIAGRRVASADGLLRECLERWGAPAVVVADRWREGDLRDALEAAQVPLAALALRGQGFKDGGEDVRLFRRACLSGAVTPVVSLLMRAAMREARVTTDPAGNAKLAKNTQGGRRGNARDDAAAAAILAVAEGVRQSAEAPKQERKQYAIVG